MQVFLAFLEISEVLFGGIEELVQPEVIFIDEAAGALDQARVEANAFRDGKSIGTAGLADDELIERQQVGLVEGHGAIDDPRRLACHDLEIEIMGGDDAKSMFAYQFFKDHFREGATQVGIAAAS